MKFSIQLFGLDPSEYLPLIERAEQVGFEAVWVADHVVTPTRFAKVYPYAATGDPGFRQQTPLVDVTVTLAFLAARTQRIQLGSGVFVLPMRNPFHVARSWAALQNLSGGRAILGVGAGWMAEEFAAVGADFAERGPRTDEMLDVIEGLWTGEPLEFHGRYFDFDEVHFAGAPQVPVPLVFGGHSRPALARAARRGHGWFGPNVDLDTTRTLTAAIDQLREQAGRDAVPFTHYVRLVGDVNLDTVRRYQDAGYEHLVFSPFVRLPAGSSLEDRLAAIDDAAGLLRELWTARA
jgi:probable F420-dependent oxidoreductase